MRWSIPSIASRLLGRRWSCSSWSRASRGAMPEVLDSRGWTWARRSGSLGLVHSNGPPLCSGGSKRRHLLGLDGGGGDPPCTRRRRIWPTSVLPLLGGLIGGAGGLPQGRIGPRSCWHRWGSPDPDPFRSPPPSPSLRRCRCSAVVSEAVAAVVTSVVRINPSDPLEALWWPLGGSPRRRGVGGASASAPAAVAASPPSLMSRSSTR